MKKLISQLSIGLIFMLFGFVIITQLKSIDSVSDATTEQVANPEILVENEQLKKVKEDLTQKIAELTSRVEEYENVAAGNTEESQALLDELQKTRIRAGLTDVSGEGIIIYINPKPATDSTGILGTQTGLNYNVKDLDLVTLVNELFAAGAETISINDIRLTGNTGIRSVNSDTSIYINNKRISAQSQIVIKVIGDQKTLNEVPKFAGVIPADMKTKCDVTWEAKDNILIEKSNDAINFQYIKEAE